MIVGILIPTPQEKQLGDPYFRFDFINATKKSLKDVEVGEVGSG